MVSEEHWKLARELGTGLLLEAAGFDGVFQTDSDTQDGVREVYGYIELDDGTTITLTLSIEEE